VLICGARGAVWQRRKRRERNKLGDKLRPGCTGRLSEWYKYEIRRVEIAFHSMLREVFGCIVDMETNLGIVQGNDTRRIIGDLIGSG